MKADSGLCPECGYRTFGWQPSMHDSNCSLRTNPKHAEKLEAGVLVGTLCGEVIAANHLYKYTAANPDLVTCETCKTDLSNRMHKREIEIPPTGCGLSCPVGEYVTVDSYTDSVFRLESIAIDEAESWHIEFLYVGCYDVLLDRENPKPLSKGSGYYALDVVKRSFTTVARVGECIRIRAWNGSNVPKVFRATAHGTEIK